MEQKREKLKEGRWKGRKIGKNERGKEGMSRGNKEGKEGRIKGRNEVERDGGWKE